MNRSFLEITRDVGRYYTGKLHEHGATPSGVDWNSASSQERRFDQLVTVLDSDERYSLIDYGCGYGALWDYLDARRHRLSYVGFDVSGAMVDEARRRLAHVGDVELTSDPDRLSPADYTVASGIFNVKLETPSRLWTEYVLETIDQIAALTRRGFAFNMLTSYSEPSRMRADLYYGDPAFFFDYCVRRHSRHVALFHDYGLYEFTLRVFLEER